MTIPAPAVPELDIEVENNLFLTEQLITYIGNKRLLGKPILSAIDKVKKRLGKDKLRLADIFAGSGFVSRLMKQHANYLVANDFELYSASSLRCHLSNISEVNFAELQEHVTFLNNEALQGRLVDGFIRELYAPENEENITPNDRVFYTIDNAKRIDTFAKHIAELQEPTRSLLLGPLLSSASVHANTAGVFKGFYKNHSKGVGQFGGSNSDALKRILGRIEMQLPVLSRFECQTEVFCEEAQSFVGVQKDFDLAYLDPPYNQHPYGSNYFMLNLICNYERPNEISRVSGIPEDWQRSTFNVRSQAAESMSSLIKSIDSHFLLVSFNDEGFISPTEMRSILGSFGSVSEEQIPYTVYRGSRNLGNRSKSVTEHLFLVERS